VKTILSRKSILFCCGLFILATVALGAAGAYQQTRDGKTQVWNGNPKPGDSASWQGSRDKQGYATGFGTITWYNANGTVSAVYYGNMVNGKLEGPVNSHVGYSGMIWFSSSRWTAHAYFVDGSQATAWARGPAPSKMDVPEALVAKRRKAESEQPKPEAKEPTAEARTETKKKPKPEPEKIRPIQETRRATAVEKKTKAPTVKAPAENIPTPKPVAVATPTPPIVVETTPIPAPTESAASPLEPPKIAETRETPKEIPVEPPPLPTPEPSVETKPEVVEQPPAEEPAKKTPTEDGSLNALVGPPSSLRSSSLRQMSSPAKARSTSAGVRGKAQLSEEEAIGLANTEARSRGYNLSEYQRPKTDYSAVQDKWSLFYSLKDPKMAGGDLQPFSVTVEDKTKKAEVRKNY
jgi:hypothetical protein